MKMRLIGVLLLFGLVALSGCSTAVSSLSAMKFVDPAPPRIAVHTSGPMADEVASAAVEQTTPGSPYLLVHDQAGSGKLYVMSWYFGTDEGRGTKGVGANNVLSAGTAVAGGVALAANAVPFVGAGLAITRYTVNGLRAALGASADNPIYYMRFDYILKDGNGHYIAERFSLAQTKDGKDKKTLQADMAKAAAALIHADLKKKSVEGITKTESSPAT